MHTRLPKKRTGIFLSGRHMLIRGDDVGYRIDYSSDRKMHNGKTGKSRLAALTGAFLLLFGLFTYYFWPEGRTALMDFLIPGDEVAILAALDSLCLSMKDGADLSKAMTVFCHSILEGAGIGAY